MKLRTGRHLDGKDGPAATIYVQLGSEPSDTDEWLGVIFSRARAELVIAITNGEWPPLSTTDGPPEHEHRWASDALCVPPQDGRATVLFRCGGCTTIAYGHATPDEIRDDNPPF